jgi:type I restriction enzyme, S subunit
MNKHWKRMKLIDVIQKTETINPQKNPDSGFEYIDVSSICNKQFRIQETSTILGKDAPSRARKFVRTGDILFATVRPTLKRIAQVPEYLDSQICSTGYFVLRPKDFVEARFLFYFLFTEDFMGAMEQLQKGASYPAVNDSEVSRQTISIPPLSEQKRIVSIVDEAFEAIDIAIDNTKQNLTNARELFESYLNAIFTQKGDGWEKNTLEDICSITSKLVEPRQPEFIDLPHVGAGNMTYLTGELIDVKTAREENLISGKFLFDETMVLYSKIRPYLMKACRPNFQGLCSADVYPLLPNYEILNRDFLFHLLMSKNFTNYAIAGSDRAGMPKVNRDHLFRYITWIPSLSEQIDITKKIDRLAIETQRLEAIYRQKLTALNELKQSILHKAFTGELTADKADLMTNIEREAICT